MSERTTEEFADAYRAGGEEQAIAYITHLVREKHPTAKAIRIESSDQSVGYGWLMTGVILEDGTEVDDTNEDIDEDLWAPLSDLSWRCTAIDANRQGYGTMTLPELEYKPPVLIPDALYRLLLGMVMCADPPPWSTEEDEQIKHYLDEDAHARGFDGWYVAFHQFKPGVPA